MIDPIAHVMLDLASRLTAGIAVDMAYLEELEAKVRQTYGGTDCYIRLSAHSRLTPEERKERNNQIRLDFNGRNLKIITRKYDVGKSTLYRIIRENR